VADQQETPKILDEIAQKTTSGSKPKVRSSKSNGSGITVMLLLLAPLLVAVVFLAYQQNRSSQTVTSLKTENQLLQQEVSAQKSQFDALQTQIQAELATLAGAAVTFDESRVERLESTVAGQAQQVESALEEIRSSVAVSQQTPSFEWKLFEAEYLLGIANQKLKLETDVVAAIAMLVSADAALLASGSSRVFSLRQAIANALIQLRAVQPFDREGVYFRLGSLVQEVEKLDLVGSLQEGFKNRLSTTNADSQLTATDSGVFQSGLDFLSSVFVWRRWDESPNALLAPEQGEFIKQNLRLMLEQSQLALLMKDQTLYTQALLKSRDWLNRYALIESDSGRLIVETLTELSGLDINPPLPSIDGTLDIVRQLAASERQ
jgi:uroporphyrin-3 C-methyltransferase